jgi:hypothetical protein
MLIRQARTRRNEADRAGGNLERVAGKFALNVDHRTRGRYLVADMNRNIFYIIGVIVVIVIVLKVLGLF